MNPFLGGESEDAFGDPGFSPWSVTGDRIEGDFFGFTALLDPSFRFRAEMETYQNDVSSLSFDCEGSMEGDVVFDCSAGSQPPGAVVPEPSTAVLLGSGLVGILGLAYRRRRDGVE